MNQEGSIPNSSRPRILVISPSSREPWSRWLRDVLRWVEAEQIEVQVPGLEVTGLSAVIAIADPNPNSWVWPAFEQAAASLAPGSSVLLRTEAETVPIAMAGTEILDLAGVPAGEARSRILSWSSTRFRVRVQDASPEVPFPGMTSPPPSEKARTAHAGSRDANAAAQPSQPSQPPPIPVRYRELIASPRDLLSLLARIGINDPSARSALEKPETFSRQSISSLASISNPVELVELDAVLQKSTHGFRPSVLWMAWFEKFNLPALNRLRSELEALAPVPPPHS